MSSRLVELCPGDIGNNLGDFGSGGRLFDGIFVDYALGQDILLNLINFISLLAF